MGVSLKRFGGWEPKVTVVYTFDAEGVRTGEIHKREPEWDSVERGWMEALDHYEASLCRRCGNHLADSTDPAHDPMVPEAHHQWIADVTECIACRVLLAAERAEHKADENRAAAQIYSTRLVEKRVRTRDPRVKRAEPKP